MLPCRRKQGCCDWEAFLISFMCSDGQIQVRNCRIKELNKIQTWGEGRGRIQSVQEYSNFLLSLFVCPHSWFFGKVLSYIYESWAPGPGFQHVSRLALPFPRAGVLLMETSVFCRKLRWIKRTAGSSRVHCSYYSITVRPLYYFSRVLAWLLIRRAIIHWGKV